MKIKVDKVVRKTTSFVVKTREQIDKEFEQWISGLLFDEGVDYEFVARMAWHAATLNSTPKQNEPSNHSPDSVDASNGV